MAQINEIATPRVVPLIEGAVYQLIPSMGGQYVTLSKVDRRYAYVTGFERHYADFRVLKYRWPEIVIKMLTAGQSSSALLTASGVGYIRMMSGARIAIQ